MTAAGGVVGAGAGGVGAAGEADSRPNIFFNSLQRLAGLSALMLVYERVGPNCFALDSGVPTQERLTPPRLKGSVYEIEA